MSRDEPSKYRLTLAELEASAHVDPDDVITEQVSSPSMPEDDAAGHLPGNVRPFAV